MALLLYRHPKYTSITLFKLYFIFLFTGIDLKLYKFLSESLIAVLKIAFCVGKKHPTFLSRFSRSFVIN